MTSGWDLTGTVDRVGRFLLAPPHGGGSRGYLHHGDRARRRISLTFDDGPSRGSTERVLDALGELGIPGTFFCVGKNVELNPHLVARARAEGHAIGSHSYRHSRQQSLSLRDVSHIDLAERAILDAVGERPVMYRPPWGWLVPWEQRRLTARGYRIVGWDVDGMDWLANAPEPGEVARIVQSQVVNGSIVLLHDGADLSETSNKTVTAAALREFVPTLLAAGYEFVRVDELLDHDS